MRLTLEEFKRQTKENPDGLQFRLQCLKCQSTDICLQINGDSFASSGCPTCGPTSETTVGVLIKCKSCGNAFTYAKEED